jgi:hypothetical protein
MCRILVLHAQRALPFRRAFKLQETHATAKKATIEVEILWK